MVDKDFSISLGPSKKSAPTPVPPPPAASAYDGGASSPSPPTCDVGTPKSGGASSAAAWFLSFGSDNERDNWVFDCAKNKFGVPFADPPFTELVLQFYFIANMSN